jgi:polysaccharide export outer membrane protein
VVPSRGPGGTGPLGHGVLLLIAAMALSAGPAVGDDTFAAGDLVRVTMREDPEVRYEGEVSAAGSVPVPYLGEFRLAGLGQEAAAQQLSAALTKDLYQSATVTVALVRKAPGKVYVYGAVRKPGVIPIPETGGLTILQLVSQVDGVTNWAAPEDAYVLRRVASAAEAPQRLPVNLRRIFANPTPETNLRLEPNDALFVPGISGSEEQILTSDAAEVIVVGEVNRPGMVSFAPGEQRTFMRAIFKAGGFSKFAKNRAVRLIRYGKGSERTEKTVDGAAIIDEGFLDQDLELLPGDMLIVPQKMINF